MNAYIYSRKGELKKKSFPAPVLSAFPENARGALLRPLILSPCTSDVHTVYEGNGPRREDLILGHEGLAEILTVGSDVKDFSVGEKVAVCAVMPEPAEDSDDAPEQLTGHENSCFSGCKLGRNIQGMWQEVFFVPDADRNLAKLPENISDEDALMAVDVMATGYTAACDAHIHTGDVVCVLGTGAVGLMAVAAAAGRKAHVIAVGSPKREKNTDLALHWGAEAVLSHADGKLLAGSLPCIGCGKCVPGRSEKANSTGSGAVDMILDATHGKGVDVCIIAGGMPKALKQACDLIKYGTGRVVNVAYIPGEGSAELPVFSLGRGMAGKSFTFSLSRGGRNWTEEMLEKAVTLHPGKMVTDRFEGFDAIPSALEAMHEHAPGTIKTAVRL